MTKIKAFLLIIINIPLLSHTCVLHSNIGVCGQEIEFTFKLMTFHCVRLEPSQIMQTPVTHEFCVSVTWEVGGRQWGSISQVARRLLKRRKQTTIWGFLLVQKEEREREKERETDRQTDRKTDRDRGFLPEIQ